MEASHSVTASLSNSVLNEQRRMEIDLHSNVWNFDNIIALS